MTPSNHRVKPCFLWQRHLSDGSARLSAPEADVVVRSRARLALASALLARIQQRGHGVELESRRAERDNGTNPSCPDLRELSQENVQEIAKQVELSLFLHFNQVGTYKT